MKCLAVSGLGSLPATMSSDGFLLDANLSQEKLCKGTVLVRCTPSLELALLLEYYHYASVSIVFRSFKESCELVFRSKCSFARRHCSCLFPKADPLLNISHLPLANLAQLWCRRRNRCLAKVNHGSLFLSSGQTAAKAC